MRLFLTGFLAFGMAASALAKDDKELVPNRFGIEADLNNYPQSTPKEALASVIAAIEKRRYDYLLAHLSDPAFVDERVKKAGGFDQAVKEVTTKLGDNPATVKELARFLKEGEWEGADASASAQLKDVKDRRVFLRKVGSRWFLENRQKS